MILIPDKIPFNNEWCAYWEDFLSEDELNYLSNRPEWSTQSPGLIGGGSDNLVDTSIRRSQISWLPFDKDIKLYDKLAHVFAEVNSRFFHCNLSNFSEQLQLTTYTQTDKGYYDWHTDMDPHDRMTSRKLSMVLILSDPNEYEGGHLQIKTSVDNITLEPKKGRAWFFPSYVLHRVTPVIKGTRKTAVLWANGPAWK